PLPFLGHLLVRQPHRCRWPIPVRMPQLGSLLVRQSSLVWLFAVVEVCIGYVHRLGVLLTLRPPKVPESVQVASLSGFSVVQPRQILRVCYGFLSCLLARNGNLTSPSNLLRYLPCMHQNHTGIHLVLRSLGQACPP